MGFSIWEFLKKTTLLEKSPNGAQNIFLFEFLCDFISKCT